MGLLNYSTKVSIAKTFEHIYKSLQSHGAIGISLGESNDGLNFSIDTTDGYKDFYVHVDIDSALEILRQQKEAGIIKINISRSQAEKVAWRIIMRWIDAQLAVIETGMVKFEEAFFAYMDNGQGQTMFTNYEQKLLPSGTL